MQIKKLAKERLSHSDSFILLTFNGEHGTNVTTDYKYSADFFTLLCFMKEFIKFSEKKHEDDVQGFLEQKYGDEQHDDGASKGFFG
ncbi:MAG: hypothetical protein AABY22_17475 [Nanoarchaeota archaeon]